MGERRTCPVCRKPIEEDAAEARAARPFCSARCKKIDLGSWLDGTYRISRPISEEELDESLPSAARVGDRGRPDGDA